MIPLKQVLKRVTTYFVTRRVVPELVEVLVTEIVRETIEQVLYRGRCYLGGLKVPASGHDRRRELWWSAIGTVVVALNATAMGC